MLPLRCIKMTQGSLQAIDRLNYIQKRQTDVVSYRVLISSPADAIRNIGWRTDRFLTFNSDFDIYSYRPKLNGRGQTQRSDAKSLLSTSLLLSEKHVQYTI